MPDLDFKVRFVTPAFLGAAPAGKKSVSYIEIDRQTKEPRLMTAQPESYPIDSYGIRIPSLRGVLEFWYRALWGGIPATEVFKRQEAVFGSANAGQGVRIRSLGVPNLERHSGELCYAGQERYDFLYLGYGPLQLLRQPEPGRPNGPGKEVATTHHKKQWRYAILVDGDAVWFPFRAAGTACQLRELERALTLLHLFGGLGSRSRRGWGSVEVAGEFLPGGSSPVLTPEGMAALLRSVWDESDIVRPSSIAIQPSFSAFSSRTEIHTTPICRSYKDVLRTFYRHFRRVRSWSAEPKGTLTQTDHDLEFHDSKHPAAGITGVPARLAFGMPYQPRSAKGWSVEYVGRRPGASLDDDTTRRSSPLLLKVLEIEKDRFQGIALFLDAQFFGDPAAQIGAKKMLRTLPFPGYGAIREFFASSEWGHVRLP
jgi:CRISPR-associated protein Cmr1